jgi:hypothetical protein
LYGIIQKDSNENETSLSLNLVVGK